MQIMSKFSSVQFRSVHHWPVYNEKRFRAKRMEIPTISLVNAKAVYSL